MQDWSGAEAQDGSPAARSDRDASERGSDGENDSQLDGSTPAGSDGDAGSVVDDSAPGLPGGASLSPRAADGGGDGWYDAAAPGRASVTSPVVASARGSGSEGAGAGEAGAEADEVDEADAEEEEEDAQEEQEVEGAGSSGGEAEQEAGEEGAGAGQEEGAEEDDHDVLHQPEIVHDGGSITPTSSLEDPDRPSTPGAVGRPEDGTEAGGEGESGVAGGSMGGTDSPRHAPAGVDPLAHAGSDEDDDHHAGHAAMPGLRRPAPPRRVSWQRRAPASRAAPNDASSVIERRPHLSGWPPLPPAAVSARLVDYVAVVGPPTRHAVMALSEARERGLDAKEAADALEETRRSRRPTSSAVAEAEARAKALERFRAPRFHVAVATVRSKQLWRFPAPRYAGKAAAPPPRPGTADPAAEAAPDGVRLGLGGAKDPPGMDMSFSEFVVFSDDDTVGASGESEAEDGAGEEEEELELEEAPPVPGSAEDDDDMSPGVVAPGDVPPIFAVPEASEAPCALYDLHLPGHIAALRAQVGAPAPRPGAAVAGLGSVAGLRASGRIHTAVVRGQDPGRDEAAWDAMVPAVTDAAAAARVQRSSRSACEREARAAAEDEAHAIAAQAVEASSGGGTLSSPGGDVGALLRRKSRGSRHGRHGRPVLLSDPKTSTPVLVEAGHDRFVAFARVWEVTTVCGRQDVQVRPPLWLPMVVALPRVVVVVSKYPCFALHAAAALSAARCWHVALQDAVRAIAQGPCAPVVSVGGSTAGMSLRSGSDHDSPSRRESGVGMFGGWFGRRSSPGARKRAGGADIVQRSSGTRSLRAGGDAEREAERLAVEAAEAERADVSLVRYCGPAWAASRVGFGRVEVAKQPVAELAGSLREVPELVACAGLVGGYAPPPMAERMLCSLVTGGFVPQYGGTFSLELDAEAVGEVRRALGMKSGGGGSSAASTTLAVAWADPDGDGHSEDVVAGTLAASRWAPGPGTATQWRLSRADAAAMGAAPPVAADGGRGAEGRQLLRSSSLAFFGESDGADSPAAPPSPASTASCREPSAGGTAGQAASSPATGSGAGRTAEAVDTLDTGPASGGRWWWMRRRWLLPPHAAPRAAGPSTDDPYGSPSDDDDLADEVALLAPVAWLGRDHAPARTALALRAAESQVEDPTGAAAVAMAGRDFASLSAPEAARRRAAALFAETCPWWHAATARATGHIPDTSLPIPIGYWVEDAVEETARAEALLRLDDGGSAMEGGVDGAAEAGVAARRAVREAHAVTEASARLLHSRSVRAARAGTSLDTTEALGSVRAWALPPLLSLMHMTHLLMAVGALLGEYKVVVRSGRLPVEAASAAVVGLASLVRPLRWVSTLVPVLPSDLHRVLEASVPVLCGVKELPPGFRQDDSTVILHLDSDDVSVPTVASRGHDGTRAYRAYLQIQLPMLSELSKALDEPYSALFRRGKPSGEGGGTLPLWHPNRAQRDACMAVAAVMEVYVCGVVLGRVLRPEGGRVRGDDDAGVIARRDERRANAGAGAVRFADDDGAWPEGGRPTDDSDLPFAFDDSDSTSGGEEDEVGPMGDEPPAAGAPVRGPSARRLVRTASGPMLRARRRALSEGDADEEENDNDDEEGRGSGEGAAAADGSAGPAADPGAAPLGHADTHLRGRRASRPSSRARSVLLERGMWSRCPELPHPPALDRAAERVLARVNDVSRPFWTGFLQSQMLAECVSLYLRARLLRSWRRGREPVRLEQWRAAVRRAMGRDDTASDDDDGGGARVGGGDGDATGAQAGVATGASSAQHLRTPTMASWSAGDTAETARWTRRPPLPKLPPGAAGAEDVPAPLRGHASVASGGVWKQQEEARLLEASLLAGTSHHLTMTPRSQAAAADEADQPEPAREDAVDP